MKHLKMLALAAVAAGALMAFIGAGAASATTLCSTTWDTCPSSQKWPANTNTEFSLTGGTSVTLRETGPLEGEGETLDTCNTSRIKWSIGNSGGSIATVTGNIFELTWGTCTWATSTTLLGSLEVHKIAGTSNGTVTTSGETRVTINNLFFGSCIYAFESSHSIGDLTEGNPAVFHLNAVVHKVTGGEFACPKTAVWIATYTLAWPWNTTLSVSSS